MRGIERIGEVRDVLQVLGINWHGGRSNGEQKLFWRGDAPRVAGIETMPIATNYVCKGCTRIDYLHTLGICTKGCPISQMPVNRHYLGSETTTSLHFVVTSRHE